MRFLCSIKKGILRIHRKVHMDKYVASLPDCTATLDIKKQSKIRTLSQNSLYWVWIEFICEQLGYEKYEAEEVHNSFRAMFLTDKTGKLPLVRSTTKLNTVQFTKYMNQIERFCNKELNMTLPTPEAIQGLDY